MKILLAPHQDDAVLFSTFTILRERPLVLNVLNSYVQPARGYQNCDAETRVLEELNAVSTVLGCEVGFMGYRDDSPEWDAIEQDLRIFSQYHGVTKVYAPQVQIGGHDHHNRVGVIAERVWGSQVTYYMTYTSRGKSIGAEVPYEPPWVALKLKALACYESQIALPNCVEHFLRPQHEYYG